MVINRVHDVYILCGEDLVKSGQVKLCLVCVGQIRVGQVWSGKAALHLASFRLLVWLAMYDNVMLRYVVVCFPFFGTARPGWVQ